ncbi:FAD-dependent oxidoreductase [Shigella flexneri]
MGVHLLLKIAVPSLNKTDTGIRATLDNDRAWKWMRLSRRRGCARKPRWRNARAPRSIRGVKVDSYLQTTQPDIYALGDCAEINGQVLPSGTDNS